MLRPRTSRLSLTNDDTSVSATDRLRREAESSSFSPSSRPETSASDWLKLRTVWSFSARVLMNLPSCSALPNSSSLLLSRVAVSRAKLPSVERRSAPCPSKLSAVTASRSESAPFAVGAVGAERDVEGVEALVDLVELDRHRGLLDRELDVVGHHLAAGVDGGDLHEPVADDRRRHDRGLGVGGQLDVAVVGHGHHDVGARGHDRLDVADGHAEDAHLAALVDRDRPREVGDQPLGVGAGEHRDRRRGHQGDDDERDGELPQESPCQPTCGAGGRFWM